MNSKIKLAWDVARWLLILIGAALFAYGFGGGRWDAAVLGLLFIIFAVAISLKLSILAIKEKLKK